MTTADIAAFSADWAVYNQTRTPHISAAMVQVVPGSARVAYMPSLQLSWGLATFEAAPSASESIRGYFQPPYDRLIMVHPQGCPWAYEGNPSSVFPCPQNRDIPLGVAKAWKLTVPSSADCAQAVIVPSPR